MVKTRPHARPKRAKYRENPEGSPPQGQGPRGQSGRRTPTSYKPAHHKNMPRHRQWETLQRWILTWRAQPDVPLEVIEKLDTLQEELHQQEEELLAAQRVTEAERQRYQELFDFAPDGYLVTDPAGVIQQVNRVAVALLNVSSAFLVNKPLIVFVAPTERKAFRAQLVHLRQAERMEEWEVRVKPRGGAPFEASLTVATAHDPKGRVVGLYWLLRDITRRKQAEEAFRQAKEAAEAANRTKSEFLATMSHELFTLLGIILGYTYLMLEGEFGTLTAAQADILWRVKRHALELHELIVALLDLSRLEAERLPLETTAVDIPTLLEEIKAETQEMCEWSGLHFRWTVEANLALIHTDRRKLKVVIKNLMGNAVKFTSEGSITVDAHAHLSGVEISILDTGMELPEKTLSHTFEPFHHAQHSTTHQDEGMGLRLHIVKRLLDLLGGTVTVESKGGYGSTFRVWVPQESPASPEASAETVH
jgi:PAS domain S-box-containing protein